MKTEKISEKHIRDEKVAKLKETGLKEMQKYKPVLIEIISNLEKDTADYFKKIDDYITEYHRVLLFEEFLKSDKSFNRKHVENPERDSVIYFISSKTIDIWLSRGVLTKYLNFMEIKEMRCGTLRDEYFTEYTDFITVLDTILYNEENKEEN